MNEQKLTKYLASYKEWLTKNPSVANEAKQEQMETQQKTHAFTKERLLSLSEDDLFEYLSPLWAMAMWGNKHYQIDNIIEANGIELLRKQFANLIDGEADIESKHSVNHVFSSPTSIINFTSKKPSYDDTRRSGRDNELLQRAQNDL